MLLPVNFHRSNSWFCFVVGYLFNGALLWLIAKRTELEMALYRPILILITVINLLYLAVIAVVVPVMVVDRGCQAALSLGPLGFLPQPYNFALVFVWNSLLMYSIVSVGVPFVYRYALICWKKDYGLREYLAMLACPLLMTVGHVVNCVQAGYVSGEAEEQRRVREFFFNETANTATLKHMVVPYFADKQHSRRVAIYVSPLMLASYSLVVVFGWRIYRHLKQETTTKLSEERARQLNQQVSRVLILMAVVPLGLELLPSVFVGVMASVSPSISAGDLSAYSNAVFAWAPVINPLTTVWVVHSYRREVGKWLKGLMLCRRELDTSAVSVVMPASRLATTHTQQSSNINNNLAEPKEGNMHGAQLVEIA